jgi:chromosome segregation protein
VFLKSLTLKGFKSFADPTTLEFEPGVTVVVGPNGSGKSNVVDAVAWVLGAQGPSTVRSAKMEDVIFAGTPKRPALGRAEVSLTIDNSAGLLPIDFTEVTITRTLFRTGESEYAINRVPCRLLDIQELLSDTGVGRQQHVIVSQGNLDAILNSRPEERRLVIEEAAGILKFRRRKERSQRRLDSTEASLVRLQDLLREVRRQLRPLEKQAEAARRHGDLVAELAAVRRYLLGRDLAAVETRLTAAKRDRGHLAQAEIELRHALATMDADIVSAEAESERARALEPKLDLADGVSRAEGCRARAAGLVALLEERHRSLERAMAATVDQDVIAGLEVEAAALTERLTATDEEATGLLPAADELAEAERRLARDADEAEEIAEQGQVDAPARINVAAEVRGELSALRTSLERSETEIRRLESRRHSTERRVARLTAERERLRQVVLSTESGRGGLVVAQQSAASLLSDAEARFEAATDQQRLADAEHHRWVARAEALGQALDQARARSGAQRLAHVPGVMGPLLELVEVEEGFQAAFEAAAGPLLSAVVVDGLLAARKGLEELQRSSAAGGVVAVPEQDGGSNETSRPDPAADLWSAGRTAAPDEAAAGGGADQSIEPDLASLGEAAPLRSRVRARLPSVAALLDRLLARAVVVDGGWEKAADLAVNRPDLVVVTRSGDRCSDGLWQIGAGGPGATGAALDEARGTAEVAAARAATASTGVQAARHAAAGARATYDAAARALDTNTARLQAANDSRQRLDAEHAEAANEQSAAVAEQDDLSGRAAREAARAAELEALLPALEAEAAAESERVTAERAARSRLAERTAALAARRRDLEVRAASLDERRTMTARRLQEVENRLGHSVTERNQAAAHRQHSERALAVTERLSGFVLNHQVELDEIIGRLRTARRVQAEAAQVRAELLEQLRRQRSTAERQLGEQRERISRAELDETEARVRLEALVEAIRRDLDCEPDAVRGSECPLLPPGTSASTRRSELERELRLMGPINPLALEEHAALLERHQFLDAQLEDVRNARRELTKVIRAIDSEIIEVFGAAYADVADNFETLFATLFPGGVGRLRLTDPDHLLETGIEVEARPSGKNVRRLSLLSGGERSLTAMAFLFAVFRSRPSPFYLMDEVEAALDDVNLHRFLDLMHEFRAEAQLLVVSHQKRTMEAADCLYGVTMAPGGSSKVISERVTVSTSN